jgi:hypothetical protein
MKISIVLASLLSFASLTAHAQSTAGEKAGAKVDDAADATADTAKKAGHATKKTAKKAKNKTGEAVEKTGDKMQD